MGGIFSRDEPDERNDWDTTKSYANEMHAYLHSKSYLGVMAIWAIVSMFVSSAHMRQ